MTYQEWIEGLSREVMIARFPNVGQGYKKGDWWKSLTVEGRAVIMDMALHTARTTELDEDDRKAVHMMWGTAGPTPKYEAVLMRQCAAARKYLKEVPRPCET